MADATPLPPDVEARWQAFGDALRDLVAGASRHVPGQTRDEGAHEVEAAVHHLVGSLDHAQFLDALHVPADAGEHEPALRAMLGRIPDGWGRWISCDRGWYPLLARAEAELGALCPTYEAHQIKSKYGTLRLYVEFDGSDDLPAGLRAARPSCPSRREIAREMGLPPDDETVKAAWADGYERIHRPLQAEYDALVEEHRASDEGQRRLADQARRAELFAALVERFEEESARTCELCGDPGTLCCSRAMSPWYTTLCETHRIERDEIDADEYAAWREQELPRFEQRMREDVRERLAGGRHLVVCAPTERRIVVDASYVHDPARAAALAATDEYDHVWIGNDEVGASYLDALCERYEPYRLRQAEGRTEQEAAFMCPPCPEGSPHLFDFDSSYEAPPGRPLLQTYGFSRRSSQTYHFEVGDAPARG